MKGMGWICLLLVGGALWAADEVTPGHQKYIKELYEKETFTPMQSSERNPFIRRENKAAEVTVETESEESKLRALLQSMSVTGLIRGKAGATALLQNMILKEGMIFPPLLEGQAEQLVVEKIGDKEIEVRFVESDTRIQPRTILIPIKLHPTRKGQIISAPVQKSEEVEKSATLRPSSPDRP